MNFKFVKKIEKIIVQIFIKIILKEIINTVIGDRVIMKYVKMYFILHSQTFKQHHTSNLLYDLPNYKILLKVNNHTTILSIIKSLSIAHPNIFNKTQHNTFSKHHVKIIILTINISSNNLCYSLNSLTLMRKIALNILMIVSWLN